MSRWNSTMMVSPPYDVVVDTKIDDKSGIRNVQALKLVKRNRNEFWYTPDSGMHVYYIPTHWRYRHTGVDPV